MLVIQFQLSVTIRCVYCMLLFHNLVILLTLTHTNPIMRFSIFSTYLFHFLLRIDSESSNYGPLAASKPKAVQCGISGKVTILDNKIVGGKPTTVELFPWFAALAKRMSSGGFQVFCGSSLILPDRLLTAAHCYDGPEPEPRETRFLVVFDLNNRLSDTGKIAPVRRVLIHEQYSSSGELPDHDIAMIYLRKPVTNTPVCLPSRRRAFYDDKVAIIMGYGSTKVRVGDQYPSQLLKTRIKIFSHQQCLNSGIGPNLAEKTICAGRMEGGVDACDGDSGGPMVVLVDERYEIVGIVSYGEGCGRKNRPGVYTDLTEDGVADWVQKNIKDSEYTQMTAVQQGSSSSSSSSPSSPSSPSNPPSPIQYPASIWSMLSSDKDQQQLINFLNMINQLQQRPRTLPINFPV